jgi:hypothetical protein
VGRHRGGGSPVRHRLRHGSVADGRRRERLGPGGVEGRSRLSRQDPLPDEACDRRRFAAGRHLERPRRRRGRGWLRGRPEGRQAHRRAGGTLRPASSGGPSGGHGRSLHCRPGRCPGSYRIDADQRREDRRGGNEPTAAAQPLLRTVHAERPLPGTPRGGSGQRDPLHRSADRPQGHRIALRGPAPSRGCGAARRSGQQRGPLGVPGRERTPGYPLPVEPDPGQLRGRPTPTGAGPGAFTLPRSPHSPGRRPEHMVDPKAGTSPPLPQGEVSRDPPDAGETHLQVGSVPPPPAGPPPLPPSGPERIQGLPGAAGGLPVRVGPLSSSGVGPFRPIASRHQRRNR